jgi:hypothetical protein
MRYDEWAAIGHANGWLGVRLEDPATSVAGARNITVRAGSQRYKLLWEYCAVEMTDEEAGQRSGLASMPKCCYWKRCSELRAAGFIEATGSTRLSSAGVPQQVCAITEAGRRALAETR